jgi:hypothetical protein
MRNSKEKTGARFARRERGRPNYNNKFQKKKEIKEEFNIKNLNFPSLNDNVVENNMDIMDFKKLDFTEEQEISIPDKVKKGWLILNKKNLIKYREERERLKNIDDNKIYPNVFDKLIRNWENYRNSDIELMGDRSRFINTEKEINDMIKEERKIMREIADYNEDKKMGRLLTEEEKEELEEYN